MNVDLRGYFFWADYTRKLETFFVPKMVSIGQRRYLSTKRNLPNLAAHLYPCKSVFIRG
jgi:hypothetical protein